MNILLQKICVVPILFPSNYQLTFFINRLINAKKEMTGRMIREKGRRREKESKREDKKKKWKARG